MARVKRKHDFEDIAYQLLFTCSTSLPRDVIVALRKAYKSEDGVAKANLKVILENVELARQETLPLCQDTGFVSYYLGLGKGYDCDLTSLEIQLKRATQRATKAGLLRPNMIDPLTERYLEGNVGEGSPFIEYYALGETGMKITTLLKGAGSENCSYLHRLNAQDGSGSIIKLITQDVLDSGAKPCPPVLIGVGLGGTSDRAMRLAKLSLLRPLQKRSGGSLAQLESRITKAVNSLGIGPMGLGGRTTTLGTNIMTSARHIASFHMGVAIQCWAVRRASASLNPYGDVIAYGL